MKKYFKITLVLTFISILAFFVYQIIIRINYKEEVAENIKSIPEFSYKNTNGGTFSNQNLKCDTATLLIYFNSECEYCNEEAEMIKENTEKLNNVEIIFVSFEQPEIIKKFAIKHQLTSNDNIHFLCDHKITFATTFDVKSLPCLVLYDKDQKLLAKIKGQTKIEILLKKLTSE